MPSTTKSEKVPAKMGPKFNSIVALTNDVCKNHLNDEYANLARQATAALCRKRPSPLNSGQVKSWACGVVYALGTVNFLFDSSQDPHMRADALCKAFSVSASTGSSKARAVRDALGMFQLHPDWCLSSFTDRNPLIWMLSVNGLVVDVRDMPREVQEIAYEQGLIPYIPDDRE